MQWSLLTRLEGGFLLSEPDRVHVPLPIFRRDQGEVCPERQST
jgi:hypothetical protein